MRGLLDGNLRTRIREQEKRIERLESYMLKLQLLVSAMVAGVPLDDRARVLARQALREADELIRGEKPGGAA